MNHNLLAVLTVFSSLFTAETLSLSQDTRRYPKDIITDLPETRLFNLSWFMS